jgi:hypothetical protein
MSQPTRRTLIATTAVIAAGAASAQNRLPQPVEGNKGAPVLGPRNPEREGENSMSHFIENTEVHNFASSNCSNPHVSWTSRSRRGWP